MGNRAGLRSTREAANNRFDPQLAVGPRIEVAAKDSIGW